jgi:hypothetical protein
MQTLQTDLVETTATNVESPSSDRGSRKDWLLLAAELLTPPSKLPQREMLDINASSAGVSHPPISVS